MMMQGHTKSCTTNNANVASHLSYMAATQPQQMAIACAGSGAWFRTTSFTELSFKQLDDWSNDIARGLIQTGVSKGVRVDLLVPP
jgi:acyl-CoA synthetase (AMP-forming)/AMP-acid ligase II